CRPRHVFDLQILNDDDRVVFAGLGTEFVQEVTTAIGNAAIELGDPLLFLFPVLRVLDHARKLALHASFLLLGTAVGIERWMQATIRESGEGGNPQINTPFCGSRMGRIWQVYLDLEGDKPVLALPRYRDVLHSA